MKKLNAAQWEIINYLNKHSGESTAEIRRGMGFKCQAYESHLRDRLFRLVARKVVRFVEVKKNDHVIRRVWFVC